MAHGNWPATICQLLRSTELPYLTFLTFLRRRFPRAILAVVYTVKTRTAFELSSVDRIPGPRYFCTCPGMLHMVLWHGYYG
jgi:hypothetical protein